MTLREHAKQVIRTLARLDHGRGVYRDGLVVSDLTDEENRAACLVLGRDAYRVWFAAWQEIERETLLRQWPTAACLIELWERPWSTSALRFAAHQLAMVKSRGLPSIVDEL